MERQYNYKMKDIMYLVLISEKHNIVEVMEVQLCYIDEYREDMYLGANALGLCAYSKSEVEDGMNMEFFESCQYYFTPNMRDSQNNMTDDREFVFYKMI